MALNSAHAGKGVLIFSGECIILFCDNVSMEFTGTLPNEMKGSHTGRLYLTTHRVIFNTKDNKDKLQSFATPFFCLKQVELEQPVFGANYIKGGVAAQPDGGFSGIAKFKLTFKHGGAIEFGQALLKVASLATRHTAPQWREAPPPYSPPQGQWSAAPPPAYAPPQAGYYGWVPPTNTFPDRPPTDGVFMYDAPPPYPGVQQENAYPGVQQQNAYPGVQQQNAYPGVQQQNAYPGVQQQNAYPGVQQNAYPGVQQNAYPGVQQNAYPGAQQQSGYPAAQQNGYPTAVGFAPPQNSKEFEANQNAFYDPANPQFAYVPPPPYSPTAPVYDDTRKTQ